MTITNKSKKIHKIIRTLLMTALIFYLLLFLCNASFADIYKYEDENGVLRLTNVPSNPKYKYIRILREKLMHNKKPIKAPTATEWFEKGYAMSKSGKYAEAVTAYSKALKLNTKYADAFYSRGDAYAKLGNIYKAINDFDNAIKIRPKKLNGYYNRGIMYNKLGSYNKAISDFDKVIELDPQNTDAYAARGFAHRELGNVDQAISDLEIAARQENREAQDFLRKQAKPEVVTKTPEESETGATEMAAKSSTNIAEEFPYKNINIKPDFENWIEINGEITNKSGRDYNNIWFDFSLYDANDHLLAVGKFMILNFFSDQTKSFCAHVQANYNAIKKSKITVSVGL